MERCSENLVAENLEKSFKKRKVVDKVGFYVKPGEVVGLLGPNGAGKSTSFNMVMGLLPVDGGRVSIRGQEITSWPMYKRSRAGIGYLTQDKSVFRRLSVRDNLLLYLEATGLKGAAANEKVDRVVAEFDLATVEHAMAQTLSGGERRRLEIARAMIQGPGFLLLDEPFSGVDPLSIEEIRRQIVRLSESGIGLLITDHSVRETLSTCDRAYIVKDGKVIEQGSPEAIASSPMARALYLGEQFSLD
jgi:lipopolysaccharide export system ATP-binding protein